MRILKWLGIGLGSILGLAALAAAVVWIAGGRILDRTYDHPVTTFVADPATADVEEGRRLAILRGCYDGCHGEGLAGQVFSDDWIFGRFVAPDLTRVFHEMSDAELDGVIRHGVRRDGRSTTIMPSASFHHLSDTDLNDITAFIRGQELTDGPALEVRPGLVARFFVWRQVFVPQAQRIEEGAPWLNAEPSYGAYLAITVCAECHAMDLRGMDDFTPSLAVAIAYSLDDFRRLMREGVPIGGRRLELMEEVALRRFKHFTDEEVGLLHDYLKSLAAGTD